MTANRYMVSSGVDENVLELNSSVAQPFENIKNNCTIYFNRVNFMLCEFCHSIKLKKYNYLIPHPHLEIAPTHRFTWETIKKVQASKELEVLGLPASGNHHAKDLG